MGAPTHGGCGCPSCLVTNTYTHEGFAHWPRGEPAGIQSAYDYAHHKAALASWGGGRGPGVPKGPRDYATHQRDGGATRRYPRGNPSGWTTAAYVAEFCRLNDYR
jgi:hypothetical protein